MKIIINKIIPFKGFTAITLWPFIFARRPLNEKVVRHESIHVKQQLEMLLLPFFVWYLLEWVVRLLIYGFDTKKAYKNISFEQEARLNENNAEYKRRHYAWVKYLFCSTFSTNITNTQQV